MRIEGVNFAEAGAVKAASRRILIRIQIKTPWGLPEL
jgi:hypothetical protein